MSYTIDVRDVSSQPIACVRVTTTRPQIGAVILPAIGQVYDYLRGHGIAPSGPPVVLYLQFQGERVDLEAGVLVASAFDGDGNIVASQLPGGRVAVTKHVGPYRRLGEANDAIRQWIVDHGETYTGTSWEIYPMPPGGEPDENKLVTDVFWKIQ